jgi:GDP-D-mannose 3', 5'-epimerase
VAEVADGGTIPVWGDGAAVRSYIYVSDMVDGIYRLMHSDPSPGSGQCLEGPANTHAGGEAGVGDPEYVTVKELVDMIAQTANGAGLPNPSFTRS